MSSPLTLKSLAAAGAVAAPVVPKAPAAPAGIVARVQAAAMAAIGSFVNFLSRSAGTAIGFAKAHPIATGVATVVALALLTNRYCTRYKGFLSNLLNKCCPSKAAPAPKEGPKEEQQ